MEASAGGDDVDRLRLDSIEDRRAGGGDAGSEPFAGDVADEMVGEVMVYCNTDSGEALLRRLSDFGGRAGDAPREELLDEAPR